MTWAPTDHLALRDLVHRYAAAVDDRKFDAAAELFTTTAELVLPDPPDMLEPVRSYTGRNGVLSALTALASVTRTRHSIVGEVFYPGDTTGFATGRIAGTAHHWTDADGHVTDVVWHLRYDDHYQRAETGWLLARRALTIDAIEVHNVRRLRD